MRGKLSLEAGHFDFFFGGLERASRRGAIARGRVGWRVDGVNTLDPRTPANVTVSFDGTDVHFTFDIPRGDTGADGPPGEVTTSQLDAAIATTALNPGGIGPYTGTFSDPPTQGEMNDFAAYVEMLRVALVRT